MQKKRGFPNFSESEEVGLFRFITVLAIFRIGNIQVIVSFSCCQSSLWCSVNQTQLKQVWFDNFHDGIGFFTDGSCNGAQTYRAPMVFFDDRCKNTAIHIIQSGFIDTE